MKYLILKSQYILLAKNFNKIEIAGKQGNFENIWEYYAKKKRRKVSKFEDNLKLLRSIK